MLDRLTSKREEKINFSMQVLTFDDKEGMRYDIKNIKKPATILFHKKGKKDRWGGMNLYLSKMADGAVYFIDQNTVVTDAGSQNILDSAESSNIKVLAGLKKSL